MTRSILTSLFVLAVLFSSNKLLHAENKAPAKADQKQIDFEQQIRPILSNYCFTCHGPDEATRATDLRFDSEEGAMQDLGGYRAIVAGDSEHSDLIKRLLTDDADEKMPPVDSDLVLSKKQIDLLKQWIDQGAQWSKHWSFVVPAKPKVPQELFPNWSHNKLDRFVAVQLKSQGLKPNDAASKETLIRRVTLDLTGLPPTLNELDAFLNDDSPEAFKTVVDRLLASPRYGEHMAWAWLDAARYADSNGYQQDRTRTMWPWRDWVVDAINQNMPFDQFTVEQLAGDLLPNATLEQKIATGFNRNHMLNGEGGRIAEESRVEYVINRVDTTSTVWLGLTAGCARCHDHKYDPLTQKEFYQLFAYFNNIEESGRVDRGGNAAPTIKIPSAQQTQQLALLNQQLAGLQTELKELPKPSEQHIANWVLQTKQKLAQQGSLHPWTLLSPDQVLSEAGATITLEDKHTVFVSGKNPAKDNYEVSANLTPGNYTSVRLQALPHDSFTHKGLARSDSGNFVLTEFEVSINGKPVKIASAIADHEQSDLVIKNTFDGNLDTGWAVLKDPAKMQETRTAIFKFAEPVVCGEKSKITVRLKHQSRHAFHNIGRFQLALSEKPNAGIESNSKLPEQVLSALSIDQDQRSASQQKALVDFLNQANRKPIEQKVTGKKAAIKKLDDSLPQSMVMAEMAKPRESHTLIRGQWDKKGDEVFAGTPVGLHPFPKDSPNNRLGLANWLVDQQNPLTARVTVNRIWQQLFGRGIVSSTEDLGSQGERPSHPELLDYLAVEFVESGWDVKSLTRQIMLSATYQQSSKVTRDQLSVDQGNQQLGRGTRYRLGSHTIRDQALFLAGILEHQVGGKPVYPYQPAGIWADFSLGKIKYAQDHDSSLYRRTLYTFWRRSVGPTMLFDTSARQVCVVRSSRTNTPLHALTLMNDTTYVEAARVFAQRLLQAESEPQTAIATGFRMATSRYPTNLEKQAMETIYQQTLKKYKANPESVKQLLSVGEYPIDTTLDATQLAAVATVTSVLLNLDEVITKE
ncbi:MAG: chromosome segregation protein [Blastopirellula sp.]|nr:MAG: chromosome segregation protein [Blastopirellula sp.]